MSAADTQTIRFEIREGIAILTFDRPDRRHAFNTPMAVEIEAAIDRVEADDTIRVCIVRAAETPGRPIFCSGYDLSGGIGDEHGGATERGGYAGLTHRARTKPLIAAIDGLAIGGGCEIVLSCDIVVASRRAAFALAEVRWNLIAAAGGITRLTTVVGRFAAMDMLLTGEEISAERAYQLGLVSRLVDTDVDAAALEVATRIAQNAPLAVRLTREAVHRVADGYDAEAGHRLNRELEQRIGESVDAQEGVRAFLERRTPNWTGR